MWRFYWSLLRKAPDEAQTAWDRTVIWIGAALSILLLFNPEAGRWLTKAWIGMSRWWAVGPITMSVVYQVARRNYDEFEKLRGQVVTEEQARTNRKAIRLDLGRLIAECRFYEKKCLEQQDAQGLAVQVKKIQGDGWYFFHHTLADESFGHSFFMATEVDYMPDPQEMGWHGMIDDQYLKWLRLLRAKRMMLEKCLDHFPPL